MRLKDQKRKEPDTACKSGVGVKSLGFSVQGFRIHAPHKVPIEAFWGSKNLLQICLDL